MPRSFSIFCVFVCTLVVCLSARHATAWQPPVKKIVVLANRQTICGKVNQQKGKVSVRLPSGSLIVLPESRVAFVCDSFGEAYWELAGRTRSTDVQGQIDVFRWCVTNNLFEEAANHLLILQEMNIGAKTLMQLDVSLQITQKRHRERLQPAAPLPRALASSAEKHGKPINGLPAVETIQIPNLHGSPDRPAKENFAQGRLPTINQFGEEIDTMVQQVSWDQPSTDPKGHANFQFADAEVIARLSVVQSLAYSDLDRLNRSMPKGAVGFFRKQVEPLLQKSCSQCHHAGETARSFKIFQGHNGVIDRRMAQKNLYQSLILSDHEQPGESLLVQYSTSAHGGQSQAGFQWNDVNLNALKQWLIMVSDDPLLPVDEFSKHKTPIAAAVTSTLAAPPPPVANVDKAEFLKRIPSTVVAPSKVDRSSENSDPFDAAVFNRNYRMR